MHPCMSVDVQIYRYNHGCPGWEKCRKVAITVADIGMPK